MNIAFYTSFLFLAPALYAYSSLPLIDVTVACVICWITSALNHAYECKNPTLSTLDCVVVRLIAAAYVIHALYAIGLNRLTGALLAVATVTLATYHFVVHVLAVVGIFLYIFARSKYLSY